LIERVRANGHNDPRHVHSEVLATLIRHPTGRPEKVLAAVVEELNARIQVLVGKRWRGLSWLPGVRRRGSNALQDTIDYVWDRIFEDKGVSNSEVRFAVFVRDRVDEFMRHLEADKNSMDPIEGMSVVDAKTGEATPLMELQEDTECEKPEAALMRKQQSKLLNDAILSLPKEQRRAFLLRAKFEYDWQRVAEALGCSVPTARNLYAQACETLQGALQ
jgi:RNA polymerase sigma factor (sigma-70 family)